MTQQGQRIQFEQGRRIHPEPGRRVHPEQGRRIGVFVCECGRNIAGSVDCAAVRDYAAQLPDVVYSTVNKYTCSEPGQAEIKRGIVEHNLDRVVVASCTPRNYEPIFRECVAGAGLNPYLMEMANIREGVSWVHIGDVAAATCLTDPPETLGHAFLMEEQAVQLFEWIDRLESFEWTFTDDAVADAMTTRIVFSGAGEAEASQAEIDAINVFAAERFAELERAAWSGSPAQPG